MWSTIAGFKEMDVRDIFDETQIVFNHGMNIYTWIKPDEVWLHESLGKAVVVHDWIGLSKV